MRITDVIVEDADSSGDYQNMQAFVKANRVGGVPPDQQVALALFKELQKQKQHNQQLDAELDAAEQRIDQATQSGELSKQELGMHRGELDRERRAGEQQKAAVGQLGQQYAEREKASTEQVQDLAQRLETVKNMPGVNQDSVDRLEKQIKELGQTGIGADKVQELENSIAAIQNAESADDAAIKDLITQVKAAQAATAEIEKTKNSLKKDVDIATQDAQDAIAQMKQDLARLNQVTAQVQLNVADAIPAQLDSIGQKIAELENENEDQFKELMKHEDWLTAVAPDSEPQDTGALASAVNQFNQPGVTAAPTNNQPALPGANNTTPATPPVNPAAAAIARQAAQQKAKLGQSFGIDTQEPESVAESAFNRSIAWATGKTK